jgi:hypothetical protein
VWDFLGKVATVLGLGTGIATIVAWVRAKRIDPAELRVRDRVVSAKRYVGEALMNTYLAAIAGFAIAVTVLAWLPVLVGGARPSNVGELLLAVAFAIGAGALLRALHRDAGSH